MEEREVKLCALSALIYYAPSICRRINKHLSNYEEIFSLPPGEIDLLTGEEGSGEKLESDSYLRWAEKEAEWYAEHGVEIIDKNSTLYPPLLKECPDAPIVLYFRGKANLANLRTVSIVGTRVPTDAGLKSCSTVVEALGSNGYNPLIISGLAIGVDAAVHMNSLRHSLETVAVLPCGIDQIYPAKNRTLAVEMLEKGGVLTEFPRGVNPLKHNFLQRNRIIAGMASALVVIESRISGGSMSTVQYASSYSRDIFALPGRIGDANSYGCNYLISKNVAQLYLNASTVPAALGWSGRMSDVKLSPDLFSAPEEVKEKILLTLTSLKTADMEEMVSATGLEVDAVCSALLELELSFRIERDSITDRYRLKAKN